MIADGGDFFVLPGGRNDDYARAGVGEHPGHLLRGQGGIERHIDGAQGEDGEVGDRPLPAIFGENGDAIALVDFPFREGGGEGADARI